MESRIPYVHGVQPGIPYVSRQPRPNMFLAKPNRRFVTPVVNPVHVPVIFRDNHNKGKFDFKKRLSIRKPGVSVPDIPGFSHVFSGTSKMPRRVFWAIVLTCSILLLYFNINRRISKYADDHPAIETSMKPIQDLQFPTISLCPILFRDNPTLKRMASETVGNSSLSSLFKLIDHGTSVETFWNSTNRYFKVLNAQIETGRSIYKGMSLYKKMKEKFVSTPTGICSQLYLEEKITDSYAENDIYIEVGLMDGSTNDSIRESLFLLTHPIADQPTGKYFVGVKGRRTFFGSHIVLNLKPFKKIRENRESNKCDETSKVIECQMNCLTTFLTTNPNDNITCRMPFMTSKFHLPECNNSTEFEASYISLAMFLQEIRMWNCNCPNSCEWLGYTGNFLNSQVQPNRSLLLIDIKMTFTLTITREYWAYTIDGLLSDVGGNMGLFLGVCIVSIVEMFEYIFVKIKYCCLIRMLRKKY